MDDLFEFARKYREEHPEVDDILKLFEMSNEEYENFLLMSTPSYEPPNSNASSTEGQYNADVSGIAG